QSRAFSVSRLTTSVAVAGARDLPCHMPPCDTLIRNVRVLDGRGAEAETADLALAAGVVCAVGQLSHYVGRQVIDGDGRVLSPGFIDTHTHDDTNVIRDPQMMAKLSQGVTTV